jgi:hypothetical protein
MVKIEQLAEAALHGDALSVRALAQDWLSENPRISDCPRPSLQDNDVLSTAAGLVELFALRAQQSPPDWAAGIGSVRDPIYLVKSALTMPRLRQSCKQESPLPLRRRGLYAPAGYLTFA